MLTSAPGALVKELNKVITGAMNIGLRREKMRWKDETKRYNFHGEA
ncbi:hypothetical protein L195_g031391 [Trifolium pratense]|uniref:Uncharacterized protein n=1 Tax=Trifolium pratense TaxID=57577 RepID=A0A2K3LA95_TRIPR|nr:hypothetical protein L195_g031391 [Trifolium pratense]